MPLFTSPNPVKTIARTCGLMICLLSVPLMIPACTSPRKLVNIPPIPQVYKAGTDRMKCSRQDDELAAARKRVLKKEFKPSLLTASDIIKNPCSPQHYIAALELTADIFNAKSDPVNAFHFYLHAIEQSDNDTKRLLTKAVSTIGRLNPETILSLAIRADSDELEKQIIFLSGINKLETGAEKDTVYLLKKFIERFPNDRNAAASKNILKRIEEKNRFKAEKIGVLLPLTGYYHKGGQKALEAIRLAWKQFNGGNQFNLIVRDTGSDPAQASAGVGSLNQSGISCIIGPMVTSAAAAREAAGLGIPMLILSQKPGIPGTSPYIFRHFMTPEQQIKTSLEYIMEEYGFIDFAILYPADDYGKAFSESFADIVPAYGGQITHSISYTPGQVDFTGEIASFITGYQTLDDTGTLIDIPVEEKKKRHKIYRAKTNFDVLFIPDSPSAAAMIAPQLKFYGLNKVMLMGTNLWQSDKLLSASPYLQQAVFTNGFSPWKTKTRQFITRFEKDTGNTPGYIEAAAYDSAAAIMELLSAYPVESRHHLARLLKAFYKDNCMTCPLSFDTRGEPETRLDLFQVQGKESLMVRSCGD